MEKNGFSCYAPAHIVHPSKEGITTTQMFTVKCLQCLALIILCYCHQFSKQIVHSPSDKVFSVVKSKQVLWKWKVQDIWWIMLKSSIYIS